jgi:hypothetical protein
MKDFEILIMEIASQFHSPTASTPVLYGEEARMMRMYSTPPQNLYPAFLGFL